MHIKHISAVLLVTVLSACNMPMQPPLPSQPDPADPAQAIASPTTSMDQPGTGSTKSIGTPVPGWENIPIMPGAYNGELEDMVYLYSVSETVEAVEEYYQTKMSVNGWTLISREALETGASTGQSVILNFKKNDQYLNVMLVNVPEENSTAAILSQLSP